MTTQAYARRKAPTDPVKLAGFLDQEHQNIQRAILSTSSGLIQPIGADPTGAQDSTASLLKWRDSIQGSAGVLPAGIYKCSSEFAISSSGTKIITLGRAIILFTGATAGLRISARECVVQGFLKLRAGNGGCTQALITSGDPSYLSLYDVYADCATGAGWLTGFDFTDCQDLSVVAGNIHGNTGNGIVQLMVVRNNSRGVTMTGVNMTGKAGGLVTTEGVRVEDGGELTWIGGVVQGGFATACFNVDGNGLAPQVDIYGPHIELTAGAGVGYRYNNSTGHMTVTGTKNGTFSIGPAAAAYDFSLRGGATGNINLGAFSRNTKIDPDQINGAITVTAGASGYSFGMRRTVGNTIPEGPSLPIYTLATRPAAPTAGTTIYVSDGGAGAVFQGWNGAAWVNLG